MGRHIGIGLEGTWGTRQAAQVYLEATSEDLRTERNFEEIKTLRSPVTRQVQQLNYLTRGGIQGTANFQELGELFYLMLGSKVDSVDNADGTWTHVLPSATGIAPLPPHSIEAFRDETASTRHYVGCLGASLRLEAGVDNSLTYNYQTIGVREEKVAETTPTFRTLDVVSPLHASLQLDDAAVDARVHNIEVNQPQSEPRVLGNAELGRQPVASDVLAVTIDLEIYADDDTVYAKFDGESEVKSVLTLQDTASPANVITLSSFKTRMSAATMNVSGREEKVLIATLLSYFDTDATGNLQVSVTNRVDQLFGTLT